MWVVVTALLLGGVSGTVGLPQDRNATSHVILVMTDGLRWQEVFRGADENLLTPKQYFNGRSVKELKEKYLAATAEERRERLMPFLWKTMVSQGQMYGDRDAHSDAFVTNGFNFSYPGYNEIFTGQPSVAINSNDYGIDPNKNIFDFLGQNGFHVGLLVNLR